ncbi:MAG: TolC family protein [Longimicrobiales bacterium]
MALSMMAVGALVAVLQATAPHEGPPRDTVVLDVAEAFRRALGSAPSIEAASRRARAAEARLEQATAWPNPLLSLTAENVGAPPSLSGVRGLGGVEGQVVIGGWLPIGGDRSALRSWAAAHVVEARSLADGTGAEVRLALVEALANAERDRARLDRARDEAAGLQSLAMALREQAARGRASDGEAARAHLAMVSAHAAVAEVSVEASASEAALTTILGLAPGTVVEIVPSLCSPPEGATGARTAPLVPVDPPELMAARARGLAAEASVAESRARRVPDVLPQIGVRRTGGISALYLGISVALPAFDRGGGAVAAARHEEAAAVAEVDRLERSISAERDAAHRGLSALADAGSHYDAAWFAALDRAVSAAEARYRLGEGTLTELLDGRRARLQALDDHERWRTQIVIQRARYARLAGETIDPSLSCVPQQSLPQPGVEGRP